MKVSELVTRLGLLQKDILGSSDQEIFSVASFHQVTSLRLTFCKSSDKLKGFSGKHCTFILPDERPNPILPDDNTYIFAKNPKLTFMKAINILYPDPVEPKITLGHNVWIHPSTVIGDEGLGYIRDEKGEWYHFPHLGGVRIEDNVRIHANSTVCRGTLDDTKIGEGTVIGSQVQVGHNVILGD
ncbi:MAG: hypothetical protein ACTSPB_24125, partial [Candidatus Thorarchaeota archaeon]